MHMHDRKTPWKLSVTRKANVRARLKKVDAVIEAVRSSGVQCRALVRLTFFLLVSLNCASTHEDAGKGIRATEGT